MYSICACNVCGFFIRVDGVLWAIRAQLSGAMEKVRDLIAKIDKGLDLFMGLGGGPKMDYKSVPSKWRAPVIPDCVVDLDQRETGLKG